MLRGKRSQRRATTAVEFAFVGTLALLFLFGIFEYARFVHVLQVTENAAREGARFAVVHTGDGTEDDDVKDQVTRRMSGRSKELVNYNVEVFSIDPDTGQATGNAWNEAAFGQAIAVRITGDYKPILPGFLLRAETVPVDVTHMMNSEAN